MRVPGDADQLPSYYCNLTATRVENIEKVDWMDFLTPIYGTSWTS